MSEFAGSFMGKLGYIEERCPYCGAHLYKDGVCLNACTLLTWASRKMGRDLAEIQARLKAEEK